MSTLLITQCLILNIKSKKILYAHCKYSCIYICHFKENANHLMPVFQHSKLEVWSRILFFSFAIFRCQNCNIESSTSLDVMYSHWERCREVIEKSVVCVNCYTRLNFFLIQVIYIYIYIYMENKMCRKSGCSLYISR